MKGWKLYIPKFTSKPVMLITRTFLSNDKNELLPLHMRCGICTIHCFILRRMTDPVNTRQSGQLAV